MQEFYTVAIRKADLKLSPAEALAWLEKLEAFPCAPITPSLVKTAALHSTKFRISYWDGAILAASEVLGASTLYTEDLNHGQVYGAVRAVNPFRALGSPSAFHDIKQAPLGRY
jgi:predicted nucleic acid-binding protein